MYEATMTPSKEERLERLIDRLPARLRAATRWLRRPSSRWARIPAGLFLIVGGLLSILPVFGLWMLPLGIALLADDVPVFRRMRDWLLNQLERRRPDWFAGLQPDRRLEPPKRAG
jgi:AcrR family transcriptional regulator